MFELSQLMWGNTYSSLASGTYQGSGSGYGSVGYFDEDDYSTWGASSTTPSNTWWKQESFDLSSYAGQSVKIRFKLTSDSSIQRAGWFIDEHGAKDRDWRSSTRDPGACLLKYGQLHVP